MPRSSGRTARQVPLAKLTPPRLPPVVERRRLFRRLDQARKRPVVWITGPPGAGKTTREEVHGRVQGWVAGLVLLLEQRKTGPSHPEMGVGGTPEVLFEYLAREVLKQLDPETQGFLLKSAVLPVMTVAMAERLTGLALAGDMLTKLYRARYFTERRIEGQTWYQYHPLFREFLLGRSQTGLPASELNTLQRTAASLLADAGRPEDAIQLWQEAGAHDEVIALILAQAPMLLAQGRLHTLEEWLNALPSEVLKRHPWLLYWRASARPGPGR